MLNTLGNIGLVLNTIDGITQGGCGAVAHSVGKALEGKVDDLKVLVFSRRDMTLDTAREIAVQNGYASDDIDALQDQAKFCMDHLALEFKVNGDWYYFESGTGLTTHVESIFELMDWEADIVGEVTVDEVGVWMDSEEAWNDTFDRRNIQVVDEVVTQLMAA